MAAVDVESLTITYGSVTAVDDLSFRAEAGQVTCVLGPNGAGKTSTIEALEGLRRPTAGRLSVVGLDPQADHAALTLRIGVMLQEGGVHPAVRVGEALRHAAALYPDPVEPASLLDQLGLRDLERRPYRRLSGGEQRRVALALALVGRPQVAFLDEPTAGVDPAGRQVIRQVIADLRNAGVTVLLTTHDLDEAERVADRVVIVVAGRLVADGTVEAITRTPEGEERLRFRAPAGLDRHGLAAHLGGATVTETAPGEYVIDAPPAPRTVAALTAWLAEHDLPLADLQAGRQRLEDVYLRLVAAPAPATSAAIAPPDLPASTGPPEVLPGADAPDTTSAAVDLDAPAPPAPTEAPGPLPASDGAPGSLPASDGAPGSADRLDPAAESESGPEPEPAPDPEPARAAGEGDDPDRISPSAPPDDREPRSREDPGA